MNLGLAIAVLSTLVISFILWNVFGRLHYRKAWDKPFRSFSFFPYELFMGKPDIFLTFARIFSAGFLLAQGLSSVLLLQLTEASAILVAYVMIVGVLGAAEMVLLFFLLLLPAKYSKGHIFVVVFYYCSTVLYAVTGGLFLLARSQNQLLGLILAIAMFVIGFGVLFLLINPRFAYWAKLHVENDKEGEVVVFRPRFFILAASEWIVMLANIISTFLLILGLLLI